MEEITIYKFQLEVIIEALRLTSNIHECSKGETCFDRQVRQAYDCPPGHYISIQAGGNGHSVGDGCGCDGINPTATINFIVPSAFSLTNKF